MQLRRVFVPRLLALSLAVFSIPADAASITWNWSYAGSGIAAGGIFTTLDTPDASGGYLITAITGSRNSETITGLWPTGTGIPGNESFIIDNLIFLGPGPQMTSHGFGFSTSAANYANPFYADFLSPPVYIDFFSSPGSHFHTEIPVQFSASPTPEPATFTLAIGSLTILYVRRRKLVVTRS